MTWDRTKNSAEINALIDAVFAEGEDLTGRIHGRLTLAGVEHFREQGAYVRVCGAEPDCYVVSWTDERAHERHGSCVA